MNRTVVVKLSDLLPDNEPFDLKGVNFGKLVHSFLMVNHDPRDVIGAVRAVRSSPVEGGIEGDLQFELDLELLKSARADDIITMYDGGAMELGAGGMVLERKGKTITKIQLREVSFIRKVERKTSNG